MPSADEICAIVKANIRPLKYPKINWKRIVAASERLSQAEISRAAEDAVKAAILEERDCLKTDDLVARLEDRRRMRDAFAPSGL
jgi:AAA+ superfamily predicted ATPase